MVVAILKLLFLVFIVIVFIVWIKALVNWDGKCHSDCEGCPYDNGDCKLKEGRKHGR